MSFTRKLDRLLEHFNTLRDALATHTMSDPSDFARLSKEYSDMTDVAEAILLFRTQQKELVEMEALIKDPSADADLKDMAQEEIYSLKNAMPELEQKVKLLLLPKDANDERNVILEIRAGTGGEEAGLFAANLLRMYQRYSAVKGWKFELLDASDTGIGGVKEASASITGKGVYARLKFESGVHRVQRVPETESSGRVHTSAATVAVLPEAEEVDIQIDEKDLLIDVFRASGAGGQHVNTTDSAVRITHLPSGVVVSQQDERSQHKNKAKAMKILRARLYEEERRRIDSERSADRKNQVGSGDRSERIRTYNYPQGRVSDHRINLTLYKIAQIMEGEALDEMIDALITEDQAVKLSAEDGNDA
ncbi:MAG: peptide chain release factor 1 [Candidatus Paracaedibacteraceae bacterium]|nr:peptide chain release factor 1 [Candidatus Paracaedibacteraceae bacterium]